MEFFMLLVVLYIVFLSSCVAIVVLNDADILTILSLKFGKAPDAEFKGKVVWITGSSSGIGEALAKSIIRVPNVKVVISARREEELERVKRECLATNSDKKDSDILVLPFDMTNTSAHQELFDRVIKKFGKLDVLVSNAGVSQRAVWHNTHLDVDKQIFDLNVFSVVHLNRIAVRHFLEKGVEGHLAVTSSVAGVTGAPFSGSYTASKHAIHGYFKSLRNEVRQHNIHVTLLCPGPTFSSLLGPCLTETPGKPMGGKMQSTDKRMTSERCAELSWAAIANKLDDSWMAVFPIIPLLYVQNYMPYLVSKVTGMFAKQNMFMKLRDSSTKTVKRE